jgi:wyosine [tRNA(Phe)-imidazoG37] synthetase (radical SAM superfamily)
MTRYLLQLQDGIIYGPVDSRRLGASLGLNILPVQYKACPFNCAYCQYGFTPSNGYISESDGRDLPSVDDIKTALEDALEEYPSVSYITFSGNGEPTLHPDFSKIVDVVKKIKDNVAPSAKEAILSNSALVHRAETRDALMKLDVRFMKLDAGDENTFRRFNRPHKDISYDQMVNGLKQLEDIYIQTLFAGGEYGNCNDDAVEKWIEKIGEIKPLGCHIYSLDRPSADGRLTLVDREGLLEIKERTEALTKIPVAVF